MTDEMKNPEVGDWVIFSTTTGFEEGQVTKTSPKRLLVKVGTVYNATVNTSKVHMVGDQPKINKTYAEFRNLRKSFRIARDQVEANYQTALRDLFAGKQK